MYLFLRSLQSIALLLRVSRLWVQCPALANSLSIAVCLNLVWADSYLRAGRINGLWGNSPAPSQLMYKPSAAMDCRTCRHSFKGNCRSVSNSDSGCWEKSRGSLSQGWGAVGGELQMLEHVTCSLRWAYPLRGQLQIKGFCPGIASPCTCMGREAVRHTTQ